MGKQKKICLCTPSLGATSIHWARQYANIHWPNNIGKVLLPCQDTEGGEIAESRNKLVMRALSLENDTQEVDSIFWLDDDVLVSPSSLVQLYSHYAKMVTGVYYTKGEPGLPLIFPGRLEGSVKFVPDALMAGMWGGAHGLSLIKTEVYKRMAVELSLPKDKYGSFEWYRTTTKDPPKLETHGLDEHGKTIHMLDTGGTEDMYFFGNAAKLGYSCLVDCSKWAFGWHYDLTGTHGPKNTGYPRRQFAQWSKPEPVVWEEPDGSKVVWE